MSIVPKKRKIRPSTHNEDDPYRVHCDKVSTGDILQIHITHESDSSVDMLFQIAYNHLKGKKSIHFKFVGNQIYWLDGIQPQRVR